jgi:Thaumatin family
MDKKSIVSKSNQLLIGLLLSLIGVVGAQAQTKPPAQATYSGGLMVFATGTPSSTAIPILKPVLIYACTDTTCTKQTQLTNSGYIHYTPNWQGINGTAPWAMLYKLGTYALWQQDGSTWRSCKTTIGSAGFDQSNTTCPGVVWTNSPSDNVIQLSLPAPDTNGFFMASGTLIPSPSPATPPSPRSTVATPTRTVTFKNKTSYDAICVNTKGELSLAPCPKLQPQNGCLTNDPNSLIVAKGKSCVLTIPSTGANSGAALVSGIKYRKGQAFTPTGQNLNVPGDPSYATRLEWTMWPQLTTNTTGVTTINTSVVNGYNVGFIFYPNASVICARAHTEGGASHFKVYPANVAMSRFPRVEKAPQQLCPAKNLVGGRNAPMGCYSDCSLATKNNAANTAQLCCTGNYANPPTATNLTPPAQACQTPAQMSRPYSAALNTTVLLNSYTWAYDDFRGTFTCDGNASFTMEITDFGLVRG